MQTQKITELTENKQRDLQLIYSHDVTCNCSIGVVNRSAVLLSLHSPYITAQYRHTITYMYNWAETTKCAMQAIQV